MAQELEGSPAGVGRRFDALSFDSVGFDLDHTLVRYKVDELMELIYKSLARYFVETCGWSKSLLEDRFDLEFCTKSIVLDLHTGDFLKLDSEGHVLRAFHGTDRLDSDAIGAKYPGKWRFFAQLRRHEKGLDFIYFLTYFDIPASFLLARLINLVDSGRAHGVDSYAALVPELWKAFEVNFAPDSFLHQRGWYFPSIRAEPERYLYNRTELRAWLLRLRKRGVKVFLLTNSHFDYSDFLLRFAFGDDWRTLFDIAIVYGQKPAFFHADEPFAVVDEGTCREGRWLAAGESPALGDGLVYARGSAAGVAPLLGRRVAYFGDHLVGDVRGARAVGWASVAVVEEAEAMAEHALAVRHLQDGAGATGTAAVAQPEGSPAGAANAAWGSFYLADSADTPRTAAESPGRGPVTRLTLGAVMALEQSDYVVRDVAEVASAAAPGGSRS